MTLQKLLEEMWNDYTTLNPHAREVYDQLTAEGETVLNDHVAFRTYNLSPINLDVLAKTFLDFGYQPKGEYHFKEKKLFARHYEPEDLSLPKIFISEFLVEQGSPELQAIVKKLVAQVNPEQVKNPLFLCSGRPWQVTAAEYEQLAKESEYASWLAAFGFRPNHFTVNVNALKKFSGLQELNAFLQSKGHKLNAAGGLIKGSPEAFLEQSSTMARAIPVQFLDRIVDVPACYYEFAKRYQMPDGRVYHGFIEKSADKIFESTNRA